MAWRAAKDAFGPMPDSESRGLLDASGFEAGVGLSLDPDKHCLLGRTRGHNFCVGRFQSEWRGIRCVPVWFHDRLRCVVFLLCRHDSLDAKDDQPHDLEYSQSFLRGWVVVLLKATWNMVAK